MHFEVGPCKGEMTPSSKGLDVKIEFVVRESVDNHQVFYLAAAPADRRASFSGSGLPFANADMAFHNTPNQGVAQSDGIAYTISMKVPNSYYAGLGTVPIQPTVYLYYSTGGGKIKRAIPLPIHVGIPFRSLTYPMSKDVPGLGRKDASFYDVPGAPVRTQELILRESAYPSIDKGYVNPSEFWGGKPPM